MAYFNASSSRYISGISNSHIFVESDDNDERTGTKNDSQP